MLEASYVLCTELTPVAEQRAASHLRTHQRPALSQSWVGSILQSTDQVVSFTVVSSVVIEVVLFAVDKACFKACSIACALMLH